MLNRAFHFFKGFTYYGFSYNGETFPQECLTEELFSAEEVEQVFKRSKSCFAAEWKHSGSGMTFFYKRNPRKNWKYTLRYLFRKVRVYRAAKVTEHLLRAGIPTPAVYFCGVKRHMGLPVCGISGSEFLTGAQSGYELIRDAGSPEDIYEITREITVLLRRIHDSGVYHGDYKLHNIYRQNGKFGVIDLDGSRIFRSGTPEKYRKADLIRLLVAVVHTRNDDFSMLPDLTWLVRKTYQSTFTEEELIRGVHQFFRHTPPT